MLELSVVEDDSIFKVAYILNHDIDIDSLDELDDAERFEKAEIKGTYRHRNVVLYYDDWTNIHIRRSDSNSHALSLFHIHESLEQDTRESQIIEVFTVNYNNEKNFINCNIPNFALPKKLGTQLDKSGIDFFSNGLLIYLTFDDKVGLVFDKRFELKLDFGRRFSLPIDDYNFIFQIDISESSLNISMEILNHITNFTVPLKIDHKTLKSVFSESHWALVDPDRLVKYKRGYPVDFNASLDDVDFNGTSLEG